MLAVLLFIFVLSFLVVIHELGHFIAAKWAKIKVEEFGLGYPPRAVKLFTWKKTLFSLNYIPFGGFVRMEGEELGEELEQQSAIDKVTKNEHKQSGKDYPFYSRSAWQRMIVILAGVSVNFVFAFLAFSFYFSIQGIPAFLDVPASFQNRDEVTKISIGSENYQISDQAQLDATLDQFAASQPRIGFLAPNSPAAEAGLPVDGRIVSVTAPEASPLPVNSTRELVTLVNQYQGQTLALEITDPCQGVSCPDTTSTYQVYARTESEIQNTQTEGPLGVGFNTLVMVHYPWWQMPFRGTYYGMQQSIGMGLYILQSLAEVGRLAATEGKISGEVGGPVAIADQIHESGLIDRGFLEILHFTAMLSINLAVINLLPIPALDGGRALFIILEQFIGKKRLIRFEAYANYGGFALLMVLIVLITARDFYNLFVG